MNKANFKAQSAIEYLMTYGWMLLVVAIAGGAVFSVVSNQTIESSAGFGEQWAIENFGYSDEQNSLSLVLQNRAPDRSNLTAIRISEDGKSYYFDTEFTVFSSLGTEVVEIPGVESQRGSNTLDIEFSYDSGSFENMESSGTVSGGFSLMDEREFEVSTLEQWNEGNAEGLDLFSLPITLDYVGSEQVWATDAIGQGVRDVDVDSDGNIFIAGRDDPTVIKYDSAGTKLWESEADIHPENRIWDIKADKNGDAYVALGRWPYEESVAKIDGGTGDRIWENTNPRYVYGGLSIDNQNEAIYAGDRNERVFLIDFEGNEIDRISTNHDARLRAVSHDSEGGIYTGSRDNTLRKYDSTGSEVWSYKNPDRDVRDIVVDSNYVYSVSLDNYVRKNDKDTGNIVASHNAGASALTISQSADNLFVGLSSNEMIRLDKNLDNTLDFEDHPSNVHGSAVKDGSVYSASTALYVRNTDSTNGVHIGEHESRIREVASDSNGNSYTASRDGNVRKYDSNGQLEWSTDTGNRVRTIEEGRDGEIYAGNRDGRAIQFDLQNGDIITDIDVGNSIWAIDADENGNIYVGTYSDGIKAYESTGNLQWSIGLSDPTRGINVLEDSILASSGDGVVRKISQAGDIEWENNNHDGEVWDVASNGDIAYTGGQDNTLKGLDLESGNELWTLSGPGGSVDDIGTDEEGNIYVTAGGGTKKFDQFGRVVWESSEGHTSNFIGENSVATMSRPDGVVKLDKETGDTIWKHSTHGGSTMWGVTTDSAGNIYSASSDNTILKSTSDGLQTWRFEGHSGTVFDVEYDDSEDVIFSTSTDNTVRKIDSSGAQLWSVNPGGGSGYTIGMSTDYIYSGHADGNVYQISKDTGDISNTYQVHDDRVWRLSVDSNYIYSGGRDDVFKKTEISTGDELVSYTGLDDRVSATHDPSSSSAFVGSYEGEVRKVDDAGNTEWIFDSYEEGRRVYDVRANSDYVFAVSNDGTLRALNKADGSQDWQYHRWRDRTVTSVHVDSADNAYLGDTYGNFYKFDPEGNLVTTSSGLTTRTQGVAMDEDEHVYAVGRGTRFTRHNNETGRQEWESPHVRTSIWNSPLDYRDGNLYITRASGSSDLGVIDSEDGSLIETIDTSSTNRAVDVASDGRIMMGISGGTQLLDSDGTEVWKCSNCHDRYSYEVEWGPNEDVVYSIGTFDGTVIAQDPANGDIIWEWTNPIHNRQEGLSVGDDGLVYAGGNDRIVNVFDGATGEEEFTIEGHSGTVYSLDTDTLGNVYSVSSDNTILASSGEGQSLWSRTDARRTLLGVSVNSADDIFFGGLDLNLRSLSQEFNEQGEYSSKIFDAGTLMTWPEIETDTISNNHNIEITAEFSEDLDFNSGVETVSLTGLDGEESHEINIQDMKYGRFNLEMEVDGGDTGNSPAVSEIILRSQLVEEE